MQELTLDFKNDFDGSADERQKSVLKIAKESIFNTYKCLNCNIQIDERPLIAYSKFKGSDNKLCCPGCLSLQLEVVK